MTKEELKTRLEILLSHVNDIPEGFTLQVNALRNLKILNREGNYVGYVDLIHGEIEYENEALGPERAAVLQIQGDVARE